MHPCVIDCCKLFYIYLAIIDYNDRIQREFHHDYSICKYLDLDSLLDNIIRNMAGYVNGLDPYDNARFKQG